MPATSAQLLAAVPGVAVPPGGAASVSNPVPNLCNASAALSVAVIQTVAASSSPRPMSGTATIRLIAAATAAQTRGGVASGYPAIGVITAASTALSGSYNPVNDLGLLPYGGMVGNNALLSGVTELTPPLSSLGMPTSLAAGASWQSPPMYNFGLRHVTWAITSSQTINLNLTRYADRQGIASIGAVTTTATAATAMALDNHDDAGFLSFSIGATNTSGSTAVLSSYALLLSAT